MRRLHAQALQGRLDVTCQPKSGSIAAFPDRASKTDRGRTRCFGLHQTKTDQQQDIHLYNTVVFFFYFRRVLLEACGLPGKPTSNAPWGWWLLGGLHVGYLCTNMERLETILTEFPDAP